MEHNDITKFSLGMVSVTGLMVASWLLWFISVEAKPCVQFLNGLMDMENHLARKGLLNASLKGREGLICKLQLLTNIIIPWLLGVGAGLNPCAPANLLAPLFPDSESHHSIISQLTWATMSEFIFVSIANVIFWKAITEAGELGLLHILIGCFCQTSIMKALKGSIGKTGKVDQLAYRQAQLLSGLFNESHVGILFFGLMGASVQQTCLLYILVQVGFMTDIFIPLPVVCSCVIFIAHMVFAYLYVVGKAGCLHTLRNENMQEAMIHTAQLSSLGQRGLMSRQRRFIRSCAPIKVAFGVSNFVEKETPLKFQNFSVDRFIDLLLLKQME